MAQDPKNLIWIDLEMTGLDVQNDVIIEIATVVTNPRLETIAEGPVIAVNQSEQRLQAMDQWNKRHHSASGLIDRVRASRYTERRAEQETLEFLERLVPPRQSPMCGNSICQDRRFMARWMPRLEAYFHYRNLDVSSLKELAIRWAPDLAKAISKKSKHRALDDIHESIAELRFYRDHFLRIP